MTADDVRARVAAIEAGKHDDERAHGNEDALWADVLAAIAQGADNSQALAVEALKTTGIHFARWCA